MSEFLMPSLGADMAAGTLRFWLRKPGDHIARGEIIAEVETEKGIVEVESYVTGTIERLLVEPGTQVPVGTPLALVRTEGEVAAASPPAQAPSAPAPPLPAVTTTPLVPPRRPRVSPLARRRAKALGIEAEQLAGTGPDGAVTVDDVERAVLPGGAPTTRKPSGVPSPSSPAERVAAMRRAIGAAMARSKREIPHYYLRTTVDFGPALAWLEQANEKRPVVERLLPAVLFVRAVALALREVPELNARWAGDEPRPNEHINVGFAITLRGGGLVAPALLDADRESLDVLMRAFARVVEDARAGLQRSSQMAEGTITVTSLGERGVETVFPIIYPPQVAVVGVGRVVERPWVVDGRVVVRPVVDITLAGDHRATDGHRGGLFLAKVGQLLAHPEAL